MGRFINADAFASTGQGILGNNMFAYCGNNPISRLDFTGSSFRSAFSATCFSSDGGSAYDYVIYYHNPESTKNLDGDAFTNHSASESTLIPVGTFNELIDAFNNAPAYKDNVYIYMHGADSHLVFYHDLRYYAEDIADAFNEIDIAGDIYLFSCEGCRGDLASTMASAANCPVVACVYKVSFGEGYARCGWENYFLNVCRYGICSWYVYYPDGSNDAVSNHYIYTQ